MANRKRKIDVAWVMRQVVHIQSLKDTAAAATVAEVKLHRTLLESIAHENCEDPPRCANIALFTLSIPFERSHKL